jgi:hypothetical protein
MVFILNPTCVFKAHCLKDKLNATLQIEGSFMDFFKAEIKGIVSRDGVSTEAFGVEFRPKQFAASRFYSWKVVRRKVMTQQTGEQSM